MKHSLQIRLSQHLALTPQLQQSIRLLQLSTLELHQEVQQMLESNPFLELEEDDGPYEPLRGTEPPRASEASDQAGEAAEPEEMHAGEFGTTEREDWENGTERDDFDGISESPALAGSGGTSGGEGDPDAETQDQRALPISLQDHLRQQIAGMRLSAEDLAALNVLLESLDSDGYLADPLEEIADQLATQFGLDEADVEPREDLLQRLRTALGWLQNLDPAGVGARSLSECLCLQLRPLPPSPARQVALRICTHHLELLARRDLKKLASLTGADDALLRQAQALIVACEPKPGRAFGSSESAIVVPDVVVTRSGRGLKVALNPDVIPRLNINALYAQAVRGQRGGSMSGPLQEARWFVKNIQQRFDTILRVSKAIVERQKNFFTHGAIAMKPLVLREIADELGLHESTISRVTTAKYMPRPCRSCCRPRRPAKGALRPAGAPFPGSRRCRGGCAGRTPG